MAMTTVRKIVDFVNAPDVLGVPVVVPVPVDVEVTVVVKSGGAGPGVGAGVKGVSPTSKVRKKLDGAFRETEKELYSEAADEGPPP